MLHLEKGSLYTALTGGFYQESHHLVLRHSKTTSLGTGHRFLGVVFTIPEMDGEDVQLDDHIAAVQFIVAPAAR